MRTYRVTIRGRFVEPSEPARERLRAEAGEHGVLSARYTAEGTVTYGPELRSLVFRFEARLTDDADDADDAGDPQATAEADARRALRAWAERHGVDVTGDRADVTCLDDIKVRRGGRRG